MSASSRTGASHIARGNAGVPPAGWFGKMPALGDFASRRLPPEFIQPWDRWLSEEMVAAQQWLGARWHECYHNAPIWRFALSPGVLDARPWCGILMPSVDRVGREYPLTFSASIVLEPAALRAWLDGLIRIASRVNQPGCSPDVLEAELLTRAGDKLSHDAQGPGESRLASAWASSRPGGSLWWPWREENPDDLTVTMHEGLPRGRDFVGLFCPEEPSGDRAAARAPAANP